MVAFRRAGSEAEEHPRPARLWARPARRRTAGTQLEGAVALKLTLLNPLTTPGQSTRCSKGVAAA